MANDYSNEIIEDLGIYVKGLHDKQEFWFEFNPRIVQIEEFYEMQSKDDKEIWRAIKRYDLLEDKILSITFTKKK